MGLSDSLSSAIVLQRGSSSYQLSLGDTHVEVASSPSNETKTPHPRTPKLLLNKTRDLSHRTFCCFPTQPQTLLNPRATSTLYMTRACRFPCGANWVLEHQARGDLDTW